MTLDVLQATFAWAYPLAKKGPGHRGFGDAFLQMDASPQDGGLSLEEFKPHFAMADPEVTKTLFAIVDRNSDGKVAHAELQTYMKGVYTLASVVPEAVLPKDVVLDETLADDEYAVLP